MHTVVVMWQSARLPAEAAARVTSKHSVSSTSVSPTMVTSNVTMFTPVVKVTLSGTV